MKALKTHQLTKHKEGKQLICCYCHRTKDKIAGDVNKLSSSSRKEHIEVLHMTSNHSLACPRCINEYNLVLTLQGEAVMSCKDKTFYENTEALKHAKTEPILIDVDMYAR